MLAAPLSAQQPERQQSKSTTSHGLPRHSFSRALAVSAAAATAMRLAALKASHCPKCYQRLQLCRMQVTGGAVDLRVFDLTLFDACALGAGPMPTAWLRKGEVEGGFTIGIEIACLRLLKPSEAQDHAMSWLSRMLLVVVSSPSFLLKPSHLGSKACNLQMVIPRQAKLLSKGEHETLKPPDQN